MSESVDGAGDEIETIDRFARERGFALSRNQLRSLRRVGLDIALRRIDDVAALIEAVGSAFGARLEYVDAMRMLSRGGRDLAGVLQRVADDAEGGVLPVASDDLDRWSVVAREYGAQLSRGALANLAGRRGIDVEQRLRDMARLQDVASGIGFAAGEIDASRRLDSADGDINVAIDRLAYQFERAQRAGHHLCRLTPWLKRSESDRGIDAAAGCACRACDDRLLRLLEPITSSTLRRHGRFLEWNDGCQVAAIVMVQSLRTWRGGGRFAAFYRGNLRCRLAEMWRWRVAAKRGGGETPLSLDAPLGGGDDGDWVHLLETVPDRTIDVLEIVLRRDRISRRLRELSEAADKVAWLYEAHRSEDA